MATAGAERCSQTFLLTRRDEHRARALLLASMMPMARSAAAEYRVQGYEYGDLLAAAMLGVNQAIDAWDRTRGASFPGLAKTFAHRRVLDVMTEATRLNRRVLREALSLDMETAEECTLAEIVPAPISETPERRLLDREDAIAMVAAMGELSKLQRDVTVMRTEGFTYHEIGAHLGLGHKQIDNALQRARKRLAPALAA